MNPTSTTEPGPPPEPGPAGADPAELLRSRTYLLVLVFGSLVGVVVALAAYFFLKLVSETQHFAFTTLPGDLGFDTRPRWWPLPLLALSGLAVGATLRYLPGTGGHSPADGLKTGGIVHPIDLPGIALAAFATLSLGVVLGPEAPLIAIGGGLGVLAVQLAKRDAPAQASLVIGAAGSFAAISTLFGSPLPAAFLLMEASGIGGPMMGVLLVPGLLAAGVGSLIYVGLDNITGFGTFSLAISNLPATGTPTGAEFAWAIAIGLMAAPIALGIKRLALATRPFTERRPLLLTPVVGMGVAVLAIAFAEITDHASTQVLFSGQDALAPLVQDPAAWTAGSLVVLVVCKSLAYGLSLSSFRGGPVFPSMFIGAAGGIALSHLPGLSPTAGAAMGIGAMAVAMLGLPLTSVMLAAVFMQATGLSLLPLIIVAVVVSYVASARLPRPDAAEPVPAGSR